MSEAMPGESTRICPGCGETKSWGNEFGECETCDPAGNTGPSDEVDELQAQVSNLTHAHAALLAERDELQRRLEASRLAAQAAELELTKQRDEAQRWADAGLRAAIERDELREALRAEHAWFLQSVNAAYYTAPAYVADIRNRVDALLSRHPSQPVKGTPGG